jgi:uncharacterized protein (TIGR03067 family)
MPARTKTSDLDALQGTWSVAMLELDGQPMPAIPAGASITLKGSKFTTSGMGADYKGDMALDCNAKPKSFDLKFITGPEKGNTALGIYELSGDTWKMCLTTRGGKLPARFGTKPGTGLALQTLVRATTTRSKANAKSKPKSGAVGAPVGEPAPELDGEWTIEKLVMDGVPMAAPMLAWGRRITAAGETKVMMGPQTVLHVKFAVDRAHSPHWINYAHVTGGATQLGIYKLEGNTLTTCVAKAADPRPATFDTKKGDGRTLGVWKK